MASGINLEDLTNNPAITLTHGAEEGGAGTGNYDDWVYVIDVDQMGGLDPSDVITLTGDWNLLEGGDVGGYGRGFAEESPYPFPNFGSMVVNGTTGLMTWSFTYADLMAHADMTFDMVVFGDTGGDGNTADADKIRFTITCFMPGTMIATPSGETAVEALAIGDMIRTADGREVAVKWVGHRTMKTSVFLDDTMLPVCISAGALGNGLPRQDLYLSANHAMVMGDVLVNAGAMVNGDTIRFVKLSDMPATFVYYHIETEAHDEILANGAPAETFVDYVTRKGFDNYAEYLALYGCDRIIPEMKRLRISSRRQLPHDLRVQLGVESFSNGVEADLQKLLSVA